MHNTARFAEAVGAVAAGASLGVGTMITACSALLVVGHETVDHRHQTARCNAHLQPRAER